MSNAGTRNLASVFITKKQRPEKVKYQLLQYLGTEKPQTGPGKLVGSMCAVAGIFSLILPIPIVVNRDEWTIQFRVPLYIGGPDDV